LNGIDNTNSKSALTKQFKTMDGRTATNAMTKTVKQAIEKHQPENLQEGAGRLKFHCAVPLRVYTISQGQGYLHTC